MRNNFLKVIGCVLLISMLSIPVLGNNSVDSHGGITTTGIANPELE